MKYSLFLLALISLPLYADDTSNTFLYTYARNFSDQTNEAIYQSVGILVPAPSLNTSHFNVSGKFEIFYVDDGTGSVAHDYTGLAGGFGIYLDKIFTPYFQMGLIVGNNDLCQGSEIVCSNDKLLGLYPEAGFQVTVAGKFTGQFFTRQYIFTDKTKKFGEFGLSIGMKF